MFLIRLAFCYQKEMEKNYALNSSHSYLLARGNSVSELPEKAS